MKVVHSLQELREARSELGSSLGLVPTMGALHRGHVGLMEAARSRCSRVLVTIFVNPTQFGPQEDFGSYPRTPEADLKICRGAGVDLVWMPSLEDLYPPGHQTTVSVEPLGSRFEGSLRPGHFQGVATVVCKLLNATGPSHAFFGEKDLQQLHLIRRMVGDLLIPVEVHGVEIFRAENGLALSSRNAYLSESQRAAAGAIFSGLQALQDLLKTDGPQQAERLERLYREHLHERLPRAELEGFELIKPDFSRSLQEREKVEQAYLCVAVRFHGVRLIDQVTLCC